MLPTPRMLQGVLANIKATSAILDPVAVYLGLYLSGPTVTPPLESTDFTLPDATDMPAQALASWSAYSGLIDGRFCIQSAALTFRLPSSTNAFSAAGWYLATALTGGHILAWEPFVSPISMPDGSRSVTLLCRIATPLGVAWGATAVVDG